MSKKEICLTHERKGYWSAIAGAELKHIEYGVNDYAYVITGAWNGHPKYHKLKIHYTDKDSYINCQGYKLSFSDCIRG